MKKVLAILCVFWVSLTAILAQDAYITVTPSSLPTVTAYIGDTVTLPTIHISQGNLVGPTYLYLSGYNSDMFTLSASEMSADESDLDITITYHPTKVGTHTAILNVDNWYHAGLFQSISLKGICEEPDLHPSLSVVPTDLSGFTAVAGQEMTQSFTVTSTECKDYVYLRVDHIEGTGFTVDNSMLPKNTTSVVTVRFAPKQAGDFRSVVTVYTQDADSVSVTLSGKATPAEEEEPDWTDTFVWGTHTPLTYMEETFDSVQHNKTILLDGWQNVAPLTERPWWGYRAGFAKATAYQFGKPKTGEWEMWLVTPPLDYKNTECKQFSFKIMGEYMPADTVRTWMEIYYIDPNVGGKALFQDLTDFFDLPIMEEMNNEWFLFTLDLTPYAETMGDVFHMAFRYVGPNGGDGAVTYYIDEVTWGIDKSPEGIDDLTPDARTHKELRDGQLILLRGEHEFDILGRRLR